MVRTVPGSDALLLGRLKPPSPHGGEEALPSPRQNQVPDAVIYQLSNGDLMIHESSPGHANRLFTGD